MSVTRQGNLLVSISSDQMSAQLTISASGSDFPEREDILAVLEEAGVTYGIQEDTLGDILSSRIPVNEVIIAKGQPALPMEVARLHWHIDLQHGARPTIMADGKADFKRLKQFEWVEKGQPLVSLLPPKPGKPGMTVTGAVMEVLPATGDEQLPEFKNCRLSEDGTSLAAATDGYVSFQQQGIVVDNVYHIEGDVDFSTGNVKFDGSVMIDGDVRSGFRVEATDSIYIGGSVEAADIYSRTGDIVVASGVLGRSRAKLLAGDSLRCGFIQDAMASVKNDVQIKHYAINSQITCGGEIQLRENEGLVRGGKLVAERGVEARELGSDRSIPTEIVLSRSDIHSENAALLELQEQLAEHQRSLHNLERRKQFLELLKQRVSALSPEREDELKDLEQARSQVVGLVRGLKEKLQDVLGNEKEAESAVTVHDTIHRKVSVTIGHKQYYCSQPKRAVKIYRKGDEMVVSSLRDRQGAQA